MCLCDQHHKLLIFGKGYLLDINRWQFCLKILIRWMIFADTDQLSGAFDALRYMCRLVMNLAIISHRVSAHFMLRIVVNPKRSSRKLS